MVTPINPPPVFFISYARADVAYRPYRDDLQAFVDELSAKVAMKLATPVDEIRFFDATSIETGDVWSPELSDALTRCRVGVPLYSPFYFTRPSCGKEYEVFRRRRRKAGPSGIVPVLWTKCANIPSGVDAIQFTDAAFPPDYAQVGMQQLLKLSVFADKYQIALDAVAERIATAARAGLQPIEGVDFADIRSAWDLAADANPQSHTEGRVSKTCFVFVARHGWDWTPYPPLGKQIGALAQEISGQLGLRYEEIKCDNTLKEKLGQTYESKVPTVLFADPESLVDKGFAEPMRQYDTQFLLNCAALVAWDEASKQAGDADARWVHIRTKVLRQKTEVPPPYHEWRSVFSLEDLESKTRTAIEQLRSRLVKQILSEPDSDTSGSLRRAEDATASEAAAALGIQTGSLAQLEGPKR